MRRSSTWRDAAAAAALVTAANLDHRDGIPLFQYSMCGRKISCRETGTDW